MAEEEQQTWRIPLVEERLVVDKRIVETGRVHVHTIVEQEDVYFQEQLEYRQVLVERVEINQDVHEPPQVRQEGDLLIIPVVEEYLFVEKRLRVREELRVRLVEGSEQIADTIPVRRMRAVVERQEPGGDAQPQGDEVHANHHRPL